MQFIVQVFGTISYFPFTIVTPYFGLLILNLFGKYVLRSNWISDHLNEWMQENILDDYPTSTHKLSSSFIELDSNVPSSFY